MGLDTDIFCWGAGKLLIRWEKCLNKYGDYVEKQLMYTRFVSWTFTLFLLNIVEENVLPYFSDNPRKSLEFPRTKLS
jgi:hypothetical protein